MSRLHTNWSRSLLRDKPASKPAKQESGDNKILIPTSGLELLKTFEVAKKVPVTIPGLFYTFTEKNGKRILQRFYSRGGKMQFPGEDNKRDVVFDIEPRFTEGHILPFGNNHQGDLIVEVPGTTNILKYEYVYPSIPETSPVRAKFLITPNFVSFDGVKSVNPDAKSEESEEESEDESEEG